MTTRQAEHDARKTRERNDIAIPIPADRGRRDALLQCPAEFLRYYFAERFWAPFAKYHEDIMDLIVSVATLGGDQAIAAPRGGGKTEILKGMIAFCILKGLIKFPVIVAATGIYAGRIYDDIRSVFDSNERIAADFPEVCAPVRALGGTPQKAAKQTHQGRLTKIKWSASECVFPTVNGLDWHTDGRSPYSGVCMVYAGMDSAIRGINIGGRRPDFVLCDDLETRESACHENQIETRDQILNRDIAGLGDGRRRLSRVALVTLQNHYCLAAQITDRQKAPGWNGRRYASVVKWPTNMEMWTEYVTMVADNQRNDDPTARGAMAFYSANREAMDEGSELLDPFRFSQATAPDGTPLEISALQSVFNLIADPKKGMGYVRAELQNDPEPEETAETIGLTAGKVASRISGLAQNELPKVDGITITVGLDIGKYYSHWVKVAWHGNAVGDVIDYGVMETPGMKNATEAKAVEVALLNSMLAWRTSIIAENSPAFCLVDSGDYTDAAYEFVRQVGGTPFAVSKGWDSGRFTMGTESATRRLFDNCYASLLPTQRIWLYHIHTEHWKGWVHERFNTATFDDLHQRNDGSLALYADPDRKAHLSFSHHVVAEERRELFIAGKGIQRRWVQVNKNNHWLDALALACAAAGCLGVRLIPREPVKLPVPVSRPAVARRVTMPDGRPFLVTERR